MRVHDGATQSSIFSCDVAWKILLPIHKVTQGGTFDTTKHCKDTKVNIQLFFSFQKIQYIRNSNIVS